VSYDEVEIRAKTVDLAIEAAMQELAVDDKESLAVEVLQEPEKGFLGMGGQWGVYKIKRRPARRRRRERRKNTQNKGQNRNSQQDRSRSAKNGAGDRKKSQSKGKGRDMSRTADKEKRPRDDDRPELSLEEQAKITGDFLEGLLDAYGLEGTVDTFLDDEVIVANVNGEQTEALVGVRGSVRSALHELSRTVLQRYAQDSARLRLDVAGYAEKRRQALTIYAEGLIDQLLADGGEIMLEPMSPADRKVIHDAAAVREGISSYSEGEPPRRYVVLAAKKTIASSEEEESVPTEETSEEE
jgi:spoIIIJ-associated protein